MNGTGTRLMKSHHTCHAWQDWEEGDGDTLAPELLGDTQPTPACDVFSLGATLYELATGRGAPLPQKLWCRCVNAWHQIHPLLGPSQMLQRCPAKPRVRVQGWPGRDEPQASLHGAAGRCCCGNYARQNHQTAHHGVQPASCRGGMACCIPARWRCQNAQA